MAIAKYLQLNLFIKRGMIGVNRALMNEKGGRGGAKKGGRERRMSSFAKNKIHPRRRRTKKRSPQAQNSLPPSPRAPFPPGTVMKEQFSRGRERKNRIERIFIREKNLRSFF